MSYAFPLSSDKEKKPKKPKKKDMAITRLITEGFEHRAGWDALATDVATAPTVVSDGGDFFGNYVLAAGSTVEGLYWTLSSAIAQARAQVIVDINPAGTNGADTPSIFTFASGTLATKVLRIYLDGSNWQVYAGATLLGTFYDTTRWKSRCRIAVDFLAHASTGWCYIYVNEENVFSYTGQTNQGASTFDVVCVGPDTSGQNWSGTTIMHDFYFDETTGEGSPSNPPLSLFMGNRASGDGNYSAWVGSDGNSVNNYLQVDDAATTTPSNTMTDYNQGNNSGDKDSYAIASFLSSPVRITTLDTIVAVRHIVTALEQSGATEQYRPFFRYSGTDLTGTLVNLGTAVSSYSERFLTAPGGGSWIPANLAALELGVEEV